MFLFMFDWRVGVLGDPFTILGSSDRGEALIYKYVVAWGATRWENTRKYPPKPQGAFQGHAVEHHGNQVSYHDTAAFPRHLGGFFCAIGKEFTKRNEKLC